MKTIKMTFNGDRAKVEVDGCSDGSCKELTEAIESALGVATNTDHKPEFYQAKDQGAGQWQ